MARDFTPLISGLRATGRQLDGKLHEAFLQIQAELRDLRTRAEAAEAFQSSIRNLLAGSGVYVKTFFVTADLTVPHPDEPAGVVIIYAFLMDSTGGWTVTFPATFRGLYSDQIDPTADTLSSIIMYKTLPNQLDPIAFGASGVILT